MGSEIPRRAVGTMGGPCLAGWVATLTLLAVSACGDPQRVLQAGAVGVNAEVGEIDLLNVYLDGPATPAYSRGADAVLRLRLLNQGASRDWLVDVRSPVSDAAEILWDPECDGSREPVPKLPLRPARHGTEPDLGASVFGAYHLRLVDLTEKVLAGDSVPVEFRFQRNGSVTVDVLVEPSEGGWRPPDPVCRGAGGAFSTG